MPAGRVWRVDKSEELVRENGGCGRVSLPSPRELFPPGGYGWLPCPRNTDPRASEEQLVIYVG